MNSLGQRVQKLRKLACFIEHPKLHAPCLYATLKCRALLHLLVRPHFLFLAKICTLIVLLLAGSVLWATTPAGTIIRNQASATYTDEFGLRQTVTSNIVETRVEQVPGIDLSQDQQLRSAPGNTVVFTHRLRNSGNGDDRYTFQLSNAGADDFDLTGLQVFADQDQDGIADNAVPLTITPWIGAGEDFYIVVQGQVPNSASDTDAAIVALVAASLFSPTLTQLNTDIVRVDIGATVAVSKSMSSRSGLSPSGPYTVTLQYNNNGVETAFDVTLIDALPEGMSYVPGSASWSLLAEGLTDADPTDNQGFGSASVRYCAYDSSCIGLPEAQFDADNDSTNQITAIISTVAPGDSGTLQFDIEIEDQLSASVLINQVEMEFDAGGATVPRVLGNSVSFNVLQSAGVVANGSEFTAINGMNEPVSMRSAAQGGFVNFSNIIWNTGNRTDTFNMEIDQGSATFPANSIYRFLKPDAATPLLDTNNDGIIDTGPIEPGQFSVVTLQMILPPGVSGNNNGVGFDITKVASSIANAAVFDSVTDHLDEIIANRVDLTNQAAAGSAGALGVGPGPESSPVSVATIDNNNQVVFDLYVRHQGNNPDTYLLNAYSDTNLAPLPADWTLTFTDADTGDVLTETGYLASGASRHILATVTLPANSVSSEFSLFFGVRSRLTGAADIKHDAIQFTSMPELRLEPGLSALLEPGGSVVHEHLITNSGNTELDNISFVIEHSQADWTAALFYDTDQDGNLSPGDQPANTPLSLLAGESANLFLKVFAPSTASVGARNITTLTATAPMLTTTTFVQDISTVTFTQVTIRKEQAMDVGCDGQPDAGTDFSPGQIEVAPGNNCVLYRLIATNSGSEASFNVAIHDYTPPYTVYRPAAACSRTPCWITEPQNGQTGTIHAETDQLLPGDSYYLQFTVQVK